MFLSQREPVGLAQRGNPVSDETIVPHILSQEPRGPTPSGAYEEARAGAKEKSIALVLETGADEDKSPNGHETKNTKTGWKVPTRPSSFTKEAWGMLSIDFKLGNLLAYRSLLGLRVGNPGKPNWDVVKRF